MGASDSEKQWEIYFHPVFNEQYQALKIRVKELYQKLSAEDFKTHTDVKRLKAIQDALREKIPRDPNASCFALQDSLKGYKRLKKQGLNDRYRLFFKVINESNKIVILWLGYPRKEGDKNDCYRVFQQKVNRGEFDMDETKLTDSSNS